LGRQLGNWPTTCISTLNSQSSVGLTIQRQLAGQSTRLVRQLPHVFNVLSAFFRLLNDMGRVWNTWNFGRNISVSAQQLQTFISVGFGDFIRTVVHNAASSLNWKMALVYNVPFFSGQSPLNSANSIYSILTTKIYNLLFRLVFPRDCPVFIPRSAHLECLRSHWMAIQWRNWFPHCAPQLLPNSSSLQLLLLGTGVSSVHDKLCRVISSGPDHTARNSSLGAFPQALRQECQLGRPRDTLGRWGWTVQEWPIEDWCPIVLSHRSPDWVLRWELNQ